MLKLRFAALAFLILATGLVVTARAQDQKQQPQQQDQQEQRMDPAARIAAEKEGMAPLAYMDGVWRGTAWSLRPTGEKHMVTQTERIGCPQPAAPCTARSWRWHRASKPRQKS